MSRVYATPVRDSILASLENIGPMSRVEIVNLLGCSRDAVDKNIRAFMASKHVRIIRWDKPHVSRRGSAIPIYGLSNGGRSAPRPEGDKRAMWKRSNDKRRQQRVLQRAAAAGPFSTVIAQLTATT